MREDGSTRSRLEGRRERISRAKEGYVGRMLALGPRCRGSRPKEEKDGSETECMYMGIRPDAGPLQPCLANEGLLSKVCWRRVSHVMG